MKGDNIMDYFIGHLVGDFLLQNDRQAQGKKSDPYICALHVGLYTLSIAAFTWWPPWALVIVFVTHFAQDHSRVIEWFFEITGKQQFGSRPMAPWSFIVVDNSFHLLTLWIIQQVIEHTA